MNERICELVEDYGLVGFETLAVEVNSLYLAYDSMIVHLRSLVSPG
jgi:hypothetical protein